MSEELLRYDRMVEDALRGVVRDSLKVLAEHGPLGDHHFYVTFRTKFPGVRVPGHILARYPDEMTIVLQHQFWDLAVAEDGFAVTLSFSGVSERLRIPLAAVTGFADPSAKFGLQFQIQGEGEGEEDEDFSIVSPLPLDEDAAPSAPAATPPASDGGNNVVTLDQFRKK